MRIGGQFGREASIYLTGFALAGLIQFAALPVYSRLLGPEQYGLYSLTTASMTMVAGVMILGGDVALARFWPEAPDAGAKKALATSWIGFLTAWSVLVCIGALVLTPWAAEALRPDAGFGAILAIGLLGMVPAQLSRMLAQLLRNTYRPVPFAATMVIVFALDVLLSLFFVVVMDLGVFGIFLGILIGEVIGAAIRFPLVRVHIGREIAWHRVEPLLRFGVPFVPVSFAFWVLQSSDRLVLSRWVSPSELGYYGFAVSLVTVFTVTAMALGQAWVPRVVSLAVSDPESARSTTSAAVAFALAGFGLAAIVLGACASPLIRILGGQEYLPGAEVLPLLGLGAAFAGAAQFAATGLTLAKRPGIYSAATVASAALCIALLTLLVPAAGMVGAAASVLTAYGTLFIAVLFANQRIYPLGIKWGRLGISCALLVAQAWIASVRPSAWLVLAASVLAAAVVATLAPWPKRGTRRTRGR